MCKKVILRILRGYKVFISPIMPPSCRYVPSCSLYMYDAVVKYGCIKGIWLGLRRILRCHPFYPCYNKIDPA